MKNPSRIILDNSTVRNALHSLGFLEKPIIGRRHKDFYDFIASSELFIESIMLFDEIYLPQMHSEDYPDLTKILNEICPDKIFKPLHCDKKVISEIEDLCFSILNSLNSSKNNISKFIKNLDFGNRIEDLWISWDTWYSEDRYGFQQLEIGVTEHKLVEQKIREHIKAKESFHFSDIEWLVDLFDNTNNLSLFPSQYTYLIWLILRTETYNLISRYYKIPYLPNPSRNSVWNILNSQKFIETFTFDNIIKEFCKPRNALVKEWTQMGYPHKIDLQVPPFFVYVLHESKRLNESIDIAFGLRNNKAVADLRRYFSLLNSKMGSDALNQRDNMAETYKLANEITKYSNHITSEIISKDSLKVSAGIQIGIFSLAGEYQYPTSKDKFRNKIQNKIINKAVSPYYSFLHDVVKSSTSIWSLLDFYSQKLSTTVFNHLNNSIKKDSFYEDEYSQKMKHFAYKIDKKDTFSVYQGLRNNYYKNINVASDVFLSFDELQKKTKIYLKNNTKKNIVGLALIDFDSLDHINVEYGINTGTIVLSQVGRLIINNTINYFNAEIKKQKVLFSKAGDAYLIAFTGSSINNCILKEWESDLHGLLCEYNYQKQIYPTVTSAVVFCEELSPNDLDDRFIKLCDFLDEKKKLKKLNRLYK